jgi:hypothetical protein
LSTDEICAAVAADTTGYVGPAYRVTAGDTVSIDHWSGQYRVTDHTEGRVRVSGPALVGSVPESHAHVVTKE